MTTVVSILMSDLVPLRDRGLWQGVININTAPVNKMPVVCWRASRLKETCKFSVIIVMFRTDLRMDYYCTDCPIGWQSNLYNLTRNVNGKR